MFFRMLDDPMLAQVSYLIGCQKTGTALVIDPERDIDRYIRLAAANDLRIVAVAETHIHADFLSGSRELAERLGAMLYLSGAGTADWQYRWLDSATGGQPYAHRLLTEGDTFRVGHIEFLAMHTPGHTPEHICLVVTDRGGGADAPLGVATGDFLFVGDVGRPDLLETAAGLSGSMEPAARQLAASSRRVSELAEFVQVWPAHGAGSACGKALGAVPQSTIGYERRFNPALQFGDDVDGFVRWVLADQPEPPLYFGRMKMLNRDGVPLLGRLPIPPALSIDELKDLDGSRVAIVDTRRWSEFRSKHLPGALFAPLGVLFAAVTGSYVTPEQDICVIAQPEDLDAAVRLLIRIGLDRIVGFATPETLSNLTAGSATLPEHSAAAVAEGRLDPPHFLLDVRSAAEYQAAAFPGAVNIAYTRLLERLSELPKDQPIAVYCQSGGRSACASALLRRHGYNAINVAGGFQAITAACLNASCTLPCEVTP